MKKPAQHPIVEVPRRQAKVEITNGGGKRPAATEPVLGFNAVMKLLEYLGALFQKDDSKLVRTRFLNGLPGFVSLGPDGELSTTALEIGDGKVAAIYVVRNPDKLKHVHLVVNH